MIKLHSVFLTKYYSWNQLEKDIESIANPVEKGEVFEQFVFLYLYLNSDYYQIAELYRKADLPEKHRIHLHLEETDYGVDGVMILKDGSYAAYQAKFRTNRASPTVTELATFWTESEYADHRYIVANCNSLPKLAEKKKRSYQILVDAFSNLDSYFFENIHSICKGQKPQKKTQLVPDKHQQRIIHNILSGFRNNDKGKLIAACGSGKTLVALWVAENLNAKNVLVFTPSLALIKQTLEVWTEEAKISPMFLCVCSDESVVKEIDSDYGDYHIGEVDFPVTTDPNIIKSFIAVAAGFKVIFSTYNSASAVAQALQQEQFVFDLIIFDEAHRTAGQKESEMFSIALDENAIKSDKRLFMTATERLVRPWILEKAALADRIVFSMDDESVYGKVFDRYTFGEAIGDGVISDYRILLTAVDRDEISHWIESNKLLVTEIEEGTELMATAENMFKQVTLCKVLKEFDVHKVISFHSLVKRARNFIFGASKQSIGIKEILPLIYPETKSVSTYLDSVDGEMSAGLRKRKLRDFEEANIGIISNAKCLTEGVDIPLIDSIYFVDPKSSLIDIVQACGRALRKPRKEGTDKIAYFIVPVLLSREQNIEELIEDSTFETLYNVIQALRDQDERLVVWIDRLNLGVARGRDGGNGDGPIVFDIPEHFDLSEFTKQIHLRIAEVNSEPKLHDRDKKAVTSRRSSFQTLFKPLGDYGYQSYRDNLVLPTVTRYVNEEDVLTHSDIQINHNNVSHTLRLNIIRKVSGRYYELTNRGKLLKNKKTDFEELFKVAMLEYNSGTPGNNFHPYRVALTVLGEVSKFNYIEFLFGVYTMQDETADSISDSINIIEDIRKDYPNIRVLSNKNKEKVLEELNNRYGVSFSHVEAWQSTTSNNKYIYFRNHLTLFPGTNEFADEIMIDDEGKGAIYDLLEASRNRVVSF